MNSGLPHTLHISRSIAQTLWLMARGYEPHLAARATKTEGNVVLFFFADVPREVIDEFHATKDRVRRMTANI